MHQQALRQSGEYILKHARHAPLGDKFYAFRGIGATKNVMENPQQYLQSFLEGQALEEQRINFLANQARVQTSQAAVNAQLYQQEIQKEDKLLGLLDEQGARQGLINFFELSSTHIERYKAVRERDQQERAAVEREISEEVAHGVFDVIQAAAELVGEMPLLHPIKEWLGLFQNAKVVEKFKHFKDFRQFFSDQEICDAIEEATRVAPIEKIDTEMGEILKEYSFYIQSYLEKQNYTHCEAPEFDPSVWPLPEPIDTYQGYYKLERFQSLKSLMDFIKLTSYFLQPIVKNEAFVQKYFEEEPLDAIIDLNLLESKEKFVKKLWYAFKHFEPPAAPVEDPEEMRKKGKKKPGKEEEAPVVKDPEPDYNVEVPEYFNFVGTKVILVCGCRRSGKSRFATQLKDLLVEEMSKSDFTMRSPKAVLLFSDPKSVTELKQILYENVSEDFLSAPRFIIIDSPPCFAVQELNAVARALLERQQATFDQYLNAQLHLSLPSKYPPDTQHQEQPSASTPKKEQARRSVSQKSGRSVPILPLPVQVDDKIRVEQSGFFKIFVMSQAYDEFLANQFGRIFRREKVSVEPSTAIASTEQGAVMQSVGGELDAPWIEILDAQEKTDEALWRDQLASNLMLVTPIGENFAEEYEQMERFVGELEEFYRKVYFGMVYEPTASDQVVVSCGCRQIDENFSGQESAFQRMLRQIRQNAFLLDFEQMSQQRMNSRFLFRITSQLGVEFNRSLADFLQKKEAFISGLDAKKLKALQEKDMKKQRQEKPAERSVIDSCVIGKLKGLQEQVFRFQQQTDEFNRNYSLLKQSTVRSVAAATHAHLLTTQSNLNEIQSRFSQLLEGDVLKNFRQLVRYQLQVDPALRAQDVIVGDYVVLTQQVAQENLGLVQRLYQQLSQELRTSAADQVQLNKRLPYGIVQRIEQFAEAQFASLGAAGMAGTKDSPLHQQELQAKDAKGKQLPSGRSKSRGGAQEKAQEKQEPQLQNDAQFALAAFFQRVAAIRALSQAHWALKYQLLAICLTIQAAVYNVDFIYHETQRALVLQKNAKAFDAQIAQFDAAQQFQAFVEAQVQGQDITVDKYLEVVEAAAMRQEKNNFLGIAPSGETVPLKLDAQFTSIASEFDSRIRQIITDEIQALKKDLQTFTLQTAESLRVQADELETHFAKAGEIVAGIVSKLQEKAGREVVAGIRIARGGEEVEIEVLDE